jgi:hypothetical protein
MPKLTTCRIATSRLSTIGTAKARTAPTEDQMDKKNTTQRIFTAGPGLHLDRLLRHLPAPGHVAVEPVHEK